jgi:hypothetical protein
MAEKSGISSAWREGLPGLQTAFNNLVGAGSANSSGTSAGLEGLQNGFNNFQSAGTTTVTLPPQGNDSYVGNSVSGSDLDKLQQSLRGLSGSGNTTSSASPFSTTSSVSPSSSTDSVVGNPAVTGSVDQQVYTAANQAFQNYGSGTKGVSDGKCFPVAKEAWLNLYKTDLTSYHAGDKSHRGKSVNELANILPSSRPGTVMYLNNSPGADPESMDMSLKPHWAVYVGGGKIVDNWANNWSIPEFIKKFGDGRLIDEIMSPPTV